MPTPREYRYPTWEERQPQDHPPLHRRLPLPDTQTTDGRPVWEPPILDYSFLIDEEMNDKIRDAVKKYYNGDVVQTTNYIDTRTEVEILRKHLEWVKGQLEEFNGEEQRMLWGKTRFWVLPRNNLEYEYDQVQLELSLFNVSLQEMDDGSYKAHDTEELLAAQKLVWDEARQQSDTPDGKSVRGREVGELELATIEGDIGEFYSIAMIYNERTASTISTYNREADSTALSVSAAGISPVTTGGVEDLPRDANEHSVYGPAQSRTNTSRPLL